MKKLFCVAILLAIWSLGSFGATASAGANGNAQAPTQSSQSSGAKRMRANAKSFDLDAKSAGQSGAQLGAGSRGGEASKTVLYAPT